MDVLEVTDTKLIVTYNGKTAHSKKRTPLMFPSKVEALEYAERRAIKRLDNIRDNLKVARSKKE